MPEPQRVTEYPATLGTRETAFYEVDLSWAASVISPSIYVMAGASDVTAQTASGNPSVSALRILLPIIGSASSGKDMRVWAGACVNGNKMFWYNDISVFNQVF